MVLAKLSVASLGYSPKDKREVTSFGYDATLTYLNGRNLLFTFDPHRLRERGGGLQHESMRTVRALLIDPGTQQVKRIVDWRVQGEGRYVWRAGGDRLVVHIGHELRLLDTDLKTVRAASLPGPLAWVSAAPAGGHFAVGVYTERHTPEVHRQLLDATGDDPEEDVDVRVYDGNLDLLLSSPRSSASYAPVLSDLGEIRVRAMGHGRWQISEYRWDRTDYKITVTKSSCRPHVSATLSGYLFVVGCESGSDVRWYRMLRPDGHPVLKAVSPSAETELAVNSSAPGEFAVRVVNLTKAMTPGQPFHKSDLENEAVSVYATADGHRLFTPRLPRCRWRSSHLPCLLRGTRLR
jgi:hypothetical protein